MNCHLSFLSYLFFTFSALSFLTSLFLLTFPLTVLVIQLDITKVEVKDGHQKGLVFSLLCSKSEVLSKNKYDLTFILLGITNKECFMVWNYFINLITYDFRSDFFFLMVKSLCFSSQLACISTIKESVH